MYYSEPQYLAKFYHLGQGGVGMLRDVGKVPIKSLPVLRLMISSVSPDKSLRIKVAGGLDREERGEERRESS